MQTRAHVVWALVKELFDTTTIVGTGMVMVVGAIAWTVFTVREGNANLELIIRLLERVQRACGSARLWSSIVRLRLRRYTFEATHATNSQEQYSALLHLSQHAGEVARSTISELRNDRNRLESKGLWVVAIDAQSEQEEIRKQELVGAGSA